ncbi:TauD/TfdA family dioxygenase [Paraburkholderia sediminicola]|uniref:TauD/TfdA family dioxygenase n=1 Tax=Paraburkholderia sediminicola TaxID=458836 RepID=UPI000F19861A
MTESYFPYQHPSAWIGEAMRGKTDWIVTLDESENDTLHRAVMQVRQQGLGIPRLQASDLALGSLADKLKHIQSEVMSGRGFVLVEGFDIDRYTLEDTALAYWGIGMHLGSGAAQNAQGDLLGHITNLGVDYRTDPRARGYQTRLKLPFHNDAMDIVGLMCLHPAQSGGLSQIVSSTTIHNEVLRLRPDLMPVACSDFHIDRRGEAPDGERQYYSGPMFSRLDGRLFCRYNRGYIESAQRLPEVPRLSAEQIELMDLIDSLCNDPRLHLPMELKRGDMQFISNYTTLHSRTDYEDGRDPERRRYLLRLWLDSGLLARLPPSFEERYADMRVWQLHPKPPIFDLSAVHTELAH